MIALLSPGEKFLTVASPAPHPLNLLVSLSTSQRSPAYLPKKWRGEKPALLYILWAVDPKSV